MLLFIEITACIIAAIRGWGWKPFLLFGGVFLVDLYYVDHPEFGPLLTILDWILAIVLVIAAIFGKEEDHVIAETEPRPRIKPRSKAKRIKCSQCAELIMKEAKVCRFCGFKLKKEEL